MKLPRRKFLHLAAGAAVMPFAPGGPNDVLARLIAQKLSERHGRQFFIENIAGASSNIGTGQAAKAAPDGYTILIT